MNSDKIQSVTNDEKNTTQEDKKDPSMHVTNKTEDVKPEGDANSCASKSIEVHKEVDVDTDTNKDIDKDKDNKKDADKEALLAEKKRKKKEKKKRKKAKKKRKKIFYIVNGILVFISLALVLTSVGKTLPLPFEFSTTWDNPVYVDTASMGDASLIENTSSLKAGTSATSGATQSTNNQSSNDTVVSEGSSSNSSGNSLGDSSDGSAKYTTPDGTYSVVVDDHASRLTVLNSNWEIIAQNTFNTFVAPIEKIINISVTNNDIYIHGINWSQDGTSISKEVVLRCSIFGEVKEKIFDSSDYTQPKSSNSETSDSSEYVSVKGLTKIKNIEFMNDNLYVTVMPNSNLIRVYKLFQNDEKKWDAKMEFEVKTDLPIVSSCYSLANNKIVMLDSLMCVNVYDCKTQQTSYITNVPFIADTVNMDVMGRIQVISSREQEICYFNGSDFAPVTWYIDATNNMDCITTDDANISKDKKLLLDASNYPVYTGQSAPYHPLHALKIIAKWAAIVYLIVLIVLLCIKALKRQKKVLKKGLIGRPTAIVCIVLAVVCVSSFYLINLKNSSYDNAFNEVEVEANVSAQNAPPEAIEASKKIEYSNLYLDNGQVPANIEEQYNCLVAAYDGFTKLPNSIVNNLSKAEKNMFYYVYCYEESSDMFFLLGTSEKAYQAGSDDTSKNDKVIEALKNKETVKGWADDSNGTFLYSTAGFYDSNGKLVGAYTFGEYSKYLDMEYIMKAGSVTVILLMACLIVVAFIIEAENFIKVIRAYKKKRKKDPKHAYCQLVRPMSFFLSLALGADSALAVLISKDLLEKTDFYGTIVENNLQNFFVGVPVTVAALALVLGIALYMKLGERFTAKKIFVVSAIFMMAGFGMTAWAVVNESFVMLTVAKAIAGFFAGVLKAELYSIASSGNTEKERYPLVQSIGRASLLASVVGVLIAGSLNNSFGYSSIYIFSACSVLIYIAMGVVFVPRGVYFIKKEGHLSKSFLRHHTFGSKNGYRGIDDKGQTPENKTSESKLSAGKAFEGKPSEGNPENNCKLDNSHEKMLAISDEQYNEELDAQREEEVEVIFDKDLLAGKLKLTAKGVIKWLLSPQMLVLILFVIVPYTASKGYKSYLFPLYSDAVGLDKMTISTIYALASAFAFIMVHPISALNSGVSNRNKIINGLLALGFIFVLFIANSRLEWAVLAMFLTLTVGRTFGTSFRMSWMRDCEYRGYSVTQLQPIMYFIEELGNACQVVVFSICIYIGGSLACVIFGVFCILSALVFGIVSYNSPMRDGWKPKEGSYWTRVKEQSDNARAGKDDSGCFCQ